jgi:hypothetical protein
MAENPDQYAYLAALFRVAKFVIRANRSPIHTPQEIIDTLRGVINQDT